MKSLIEFDHVIVTRRGLLFEDSEGEYGYRSPDVRIPRLLKAIETLERSKFLKFVSGDKNECYFRINK